LAIFFCRIKCIFFSFGFVGTIFHDGVGERIYDKTTTRNQMKNTRGGFIATILDIIDFHQKPNFKIYIVQPQNSY
jgi:hypothetical protein